MRWVRCAWTIVLLYCYIYYSSSDTIALFKTIGLEESPVKHEYIVTTDNQPNGSTAFTSCNGNAPVD